MLKSRGVDFLFQSTAARKWGKGGLLVYIRVTGNWILNVVWYLDPYNEPDRRNR